MIVICEYWELDCQLLSTKECGHFYRI